MTSLKTVTSGVGAMAPALSLLSGTTTINALGDSISAQGAYFPVTTSLATIPAWQPNTAYVVGYLVLNGGLLYRCVTAGTSAASGGPTGTSQNALTDNTAQWAYVYFVANRSPCSFLYWVEAISLGRLQWDMSRGYSGTLQGLLKVIVINGGSNYTAPTITFSNGATGTVQTKNGVITGVSIVNPGYSPSSFSYSLSDATGSGCVLSLVAIPAGTFGVSGCQTLDMVARLPDVAASNVDIIVVLGGTNDITSGGTLASITGNLRICYETLMNAGKKVIAVPILPRCGLTNAQMALLLSVNRWIRGYARKDSWANAQGFDNIALADPTRYWTDGTNLSNQPIGLANVGNGAMTYDGLHPSSRGAQYLALSIIKAAQQWIGVLPDTTARSSTMFDGYDPVLNIGGNYLEGYPWAASSSYVLNQLCSNGNNTYICIQAGTSASSGGPTGTSSSITDNTAKWKYLYPQGLSIFGSGTQAMPGTTGSVTCSGTFAKGWYFSRLNGNAAGTVVGAVESPWSDGQMGTRQSLTFTLGSGSSNEQWVMYLWATTAPTSIGINASDLGVTSFVAECEVELSGLANFTHIGLQFWDGNNPSNQFYNEAGKIVSPGTPTHLTEMASSNEMLALPNGNKRLIRTQPFVLPANLTNISLYLLVALDCSGSANSATATIKLNQISVRKAGVA